MLNKINVSHLVWYLVPGVCLIFFVLFPVLVFDAKIASAVVEKLGVLGILVLGVVLGFIIDGLRLYRHRKGYDEDKKTFFEDLLAVTETTGEYDPYYVLNVLNDMAIKDKNTSISLRHAIWIMHGNIAALCYMQSVFWFGAGAMITFYKNGLDTVCLFGIETVFIVAIFACIVMATLFLLCGVKIMKISAEDQRTTNNMFLGYARSHKSKICDLVKGKG